MARTARPNVLIIASDGASLQEYDGNLSDLLNYRLIEMHLQSYALTKMEKANTLVWTCAKGQLSHAVALRES
ncbi:hypothetical protein ASNO1_07770 [Corallococcus caeni]|uniref:Uncharacterized protein n=1 Tax=Corallococcus caeni TaxID=3082388 RepID=A0ABQ6QKI0_9BACT|nr:hypothetical protein ASNO1_07770 [Corallococcus sp. NO1]